jgi:hypothetical protein
MTHHPLVARRCRADARKGDTRRFAKTGAGAGGIGVRGGSDVAVAITPTCRHERAFLLCADAWLPHPHAAQPNPNPSDTTPIPTEYKRV